MRVLILFASIALVCACATSRAVKVRCDRHLVPINVSSTAKAGEPSYDRPSALRSVVR